MRVALLSCALLYAPSAHASTTWLLGAQIGPSPFVLHIGPVFSRERTGAWRAGGSAALGYALWRARALMELQLDVTRGFTRVPARDTEVPWAMTLSLVLRAVPLTPWSTGH